MSDNVFISFRNSLFISIFLICLPIAIASEEIPAFDADVQAIGTSIQQKELAQAQTAVDQFWSEHSGEDGFVDALRRIKDYYWANEFYAAHFDLCERIVASFPNDPLSIGIQVDQVTGYIKQKELTKASEKLEQFWNLYSSDERFVDFARRIKDQYWWDGYHQEHFELCERLIEAFPDDPLTMSVYADDITGYIKTEDIETAAVRLDAFWSQYSSKEGFTSHLRTIKDVYWSKGYTAEHDALCDRIIQNFPNDPVTLETLAGRIAGVIHGQDVTKASEDLEQFWTAHKNDEGFVNAVRRVKDQYWAGGYYDEHFDLCERIVNEFPDDPLAMGIQIDQVTGYLKRDNMTRAAEELEQFWIQFNSKDGFVERAHSLGWDFVVHQNYDVALQIYQDLLMQYPDHERAPWFQRSIVQTYLAMGDLENVTIAVDDLKDNFKNCPDYINQMDITAQRLRAGHVYTPALGIYDSLLTADPNCMQAVFFQRSKIQCLLEAGDRVGAREALAGLSAYENRPEYVQQIHELGWEFSTRGDEDTALQIYQDLKQRFPNHERAAWFQRSIIQLYLEKQDEAKLTDAVEELMNNFQNHPDFVNQMEIVAGRLTDSEQYDLAKGIYDSLLEQHPDSVRKIWFLQCKIRADLGKKDVASADAAAASIHQDYAHHNDYHDALSWAAYEYRNYGYYDKAIAMYQDLYAMNPNKKVQLRCDEGIARCYVRLGDDAEVEEQIQRIYTDYYDDNPQGVAFYVLGIAEQYYWVGLSQTDADLAAAAYQKGIDILETMVSTVPDNHHRCMVFYVMGLCYWQLEDWFSAASALMESIEAEPGYVYAGSMHRMISNCYTSLKADGQITAEEADPIIEWGYRTLFEEYPDSRDVIPAAIHLIEINLARGRPVTAGVYINWILDHTEVDDPRRMLALHRITAGLEVCE